VLTSPEKKLLEYKELQNKIYTLNRHGLNYAKLFLDFEGGYNMEELKTIMQRIK